MSRAGCGGAYELLASLDSSPAALWRSLEIRVRLDTFLSRYCKGYSPGVSTVLKTIKMMITVTEI